MGGQTLFMSPLFVRRSKEFRQNLVGFIEISRESHKNFIEIQMQESMFDATATPALQIKVHIRAYRASMRALQVYPFF